MTESQRLAGEYESQCISVKLWLVTAIALFAVGSVVMGLYFSLFTVRAGGVVFIVLLTAAGIAGAVASLRRRSLASARKKEISEELKKSIFREASEEYLTEFRIVPLDELPSNYDLNRMFALNDALDITKLYRGRSSVPFSGHRGYNVSGRGRRCAERPVCALGSRADG